MTALPAYQELAKKPHMTSVWTSSCAFGSEHLKQFVFLCAWLDASSLHRPCTCRKKHKPVKGKHAKASATYTPGLAVEVCSLLTKALIHRRSRLADANLETSGLERISTTDLALSLSWREESCWEWGNEVHINILEASVISRLYKKVAVETGPCRFTNLCDSHVAQSAVGKGRSASDGLRHVTRRTSMISLVSGLYPGNLFCPTRVMPAGHPTRDALFTSSLSGHRQRLLDSRAPPNRCSTSEAAQMGRILGPPHAPS